MTSQQKNATTQLQLFKLTVLCAFILILTTVPLLAQQGQPIDHVYYPGYVEVTIPISIFMKPELRTACEFLQRGDSKSAEPIFAREVRDHPEDLPAYVGYLQAARDHRDQLYLDYFHQAEYSPRPENAFRFGVLAFYMSGERFNSNKMLEYEALSKMARQYLQRAYDFSHEPITGFMLIDTMPYTGGGDDISIYEAMLYRLGGTAPYSAYVKAKLAHWRAPQPPVPRLSATDITVYAWIVHKIWSTHGILIYKPHTVDGETVYKADEADYTPEQRAAMAYLSEWHDRLVSDASQKQK